MKVDFIELTNFRGIQKQKITFENKNFVALIGDNGSGKTTILEAITKGFRNIMIRAAKDNPVSPSYSSLMTAPSAINSAISVARVTEGEKPVTAAKKVSTGTAIKKVKIRLRRKKK